jgi:uncharacterized membrane protein (UPF0136 family)
MKRISLVMLVSAGVILGILFFWSFAGNVTEEGKKMMVDIAVIISVAVSAVTLLLQRIEKWT